MPAPLAPFSMPDRYRLERAIAAGGMAAVYAAHDELLDRPVAVKVLADHLNDDEAARRRFQREARAAAALSSHPGVVTIFDVGEHEGRSYIVMERRTGGTLREAMDAGPVDPRRALAWLHTTAEALDAAHERGVVHRDIKPANLLLDERDRVAVADFGIALLAYESEQVTQTGQVLGTASYISPEQATGDAATAASDRYALAAVAFELLTGRKPFEADHFAAQARAHIEDPVPAASKHNPQLPRAVDAVLRRGLAKEPQDRWASATGFVNALEAALEEGPTEATQAMAAPLAGRDPSPTPRRDPRPVQAAPRPAPPRRRPPVPPPPPSGPPAGRRRVGVLLAALAALLVTGGALALALGGGGGDDSSGADTATRTDQSGTANGDARADKPKKGAKAKAEAKTTPTPEPTPVPTAAPTEEPEPEPTSAPTEAPTEEAAPEPSGGTPSELNDQGFVRFQAGDYAGSIPYFRRAVEACGSSAELTCAYATYNLGAALNRSGDPASAIPLLQQRLDRWPTNQPGTVRAELRQACRAAGQDCG